MSVWGLGSPGAQSPMPVSHTHHPEAEVLRAGRGRCAAPMGRQRQHKQQWRQPGLRAWRTRSPGGSRSPRAASHPALAGRVARVPAAASSQLRASLGSAPAPLRSAGLSRAPARLRGRAMLMYANRRRPAHSLKGAPRAGGTRSWARKVCSPRRLEHCRKQGAGGSGCECPRVPCRPLVAC